MNGQGYQIVLLSLLYVSPAWVTEEKPKDKSAERVEEAFIAGTVRWYTKKRHDVPWLYRWLDRKLEAPLQEDKERNRFPPPWKLSMRSDIDMVWTKDFVAQFDYQWRDKDNPWIWLYSKKENQTVQAELDHKFKVVDSFAAPTKGPYSFHGLYELLKDTPFEKWEAELKRFVTAHDEYAGPPKILYEFDRPTQHIPEEYRKLDYERIRRDAIAAWERRMR